MPDIEVTYADALSDRVARAESQRAALTAAIEETRAARSLMFADDEHDPDGSTASLDQARDVALLEQTERTLSELAEAQRRLASGTYGRCELCGGTIPSERMLARPETRRCVVCAACEEGRRRGRS
ncbi:MAG TPA: TraR/DksA C4-type zinc finger protein [Microlunatus sp.]|nr:TraR/DksA C4-type zinc finger protein [Microlunatus sp.]